MSPDEARKMMVQLITAGKLIYTLNEGVFDHPAMIIGLMEAATTHFLGEVKDEENVELDNISKVLLIPVYVRLTVFLFGKDEARYLLNEALDKVDNHEIDREQVLEILTNGL